VIHVDDFMHVRSVRHRRGRNSPEGYFHDSYDYESLTRYVLEPLAGSGGGWFGAVPRTVFLARIAGFETGGMGTVSNDFRDRESTEEARC
jgi:hypothetical protein